MSLKFKRFILNIKNNKWGTIFYLSFIGLIVILGFAVWDWINIKRSENKAELLSSIVSQKQAELDILHNNFELKKYRLGEYIYNEENSLSWYNTINILISIFNDLKAISKSSTNLVLRDFRVTSERVELVGEINNLKNVYMSGGIIDKFTSPEFVELLIIPSYNLQNDQYIFNLNANIKLTNDYGNQGTLK